jgi:hypothetical protein
MTALNESALIDGADWAAAFTVKIFDIKEITAKVTNDPKDGEVELRLEQQSRARSFNALIELV